MLRNQAQTAATGRNIGAPICGIKLIPLSRPGGDERKTFEHFAKGCSHHNQEVDIQPGRKKPVLLKIGFPAPTMPEDNSSMDVYTCTGCVNYVPPIPTRKATGYSAAYCKAKGSLLLEDRLDQYAYACDEKVPVDLGKRIQDNGQTVVNIPILPEYSLDFGKPKKLDINKIHTLNISTLPLNYNSDAPITEGMKRQGIKSLRRIEDPKGYGKNVFIPIMDPMALDGEGKRIFTDEDVSRIPQSGDAERPEFYFDHNGSVYLITVMWTKLKQTPAVWGIAGTGKTELFRHMAWMMGMPFQRISITESSELDDLAGKMMYTPEKGTYFQYGRVPSAWQKPNVICLDEPNTGPPAVWQFLRPLTDNSKQLVVDQNGGERIAAHKLSYLGLAMNPDWDPRNIGAMPLADADGSRLMHIDMGLPPEHVETRIITESLELSGWEVDEANETVKILMKIAKEVRQHSEDGTIPISWGIRNQKKVAGAKRYMSWKDAFRVGVTNSLEPKTAEVILSIVEGYDED